jgi:site-specific recombinase XerD
MARFLAERGDGKSLWLADRDDIAAFHEARRLSPPPYRVSASSWNRSVAALDKFYRWAVDEKLIEAAPFTCREWQAGRGPRKVKAGRRTLITAEALGSWLRSLEHASET